jgi:hypothetical protein
VTTGGDAGGGVFEIRLKGEIGEHALALFDGFDHLVEPTTTIVRGPVVDDDELAEVCRRIRDAGFELISLRRVARTGGPESPTSGEAPL